MQPSDNGLGIGEVVERTGVAEATLRMWERRYGFPVPERLASGHRRYSEREIELIRAVAAKRAAGLALPVAIEQVRSEGSQRATSVYAALRRRRPDLEPRVLLKPMMLALSHAVEDEAMARAERLMVFGSFQRERFYRQAQMRWRELARTAEVAVVFADFARLRAPRDGPVEVPVPRAHPLNREWALVCEGQDFALCLTGWEPPESAHGPGTLCLSCCTTPSPGASSTLLGRARARRCLTCAGGGRRSCGTSCTREIKQVMGRTVIGFTSDNHIDAALAVEVFIFEPAGADPAVRAAVAVADPAPG